MPLWVMVAGPNGSGKRTLTDALRLAPHMKLPAQYINADELQKSQKLDAAAAQQAAAMLRQRLLAQRRDVMQHCSFNLNPAVTPTLRASEAA